MRPLEWTMSHRENDLIVRQLHCNFSAQEGGEGTCDSFARDSLLDYVNK
jgi:hypothetical protein